MHRQASFYLLLPAILLLPSVLVDGFHPSSLRFRRNGLSKPSHLTPLPRVQEEAVGDRAARRRALLIPFSTFSSFFHERAHNASSAGAGANANLAYELRLLELESRLLKLEGITARAGKNIGGSSSSNRSNGGKSAANGNQFNHILPDGEQLLLGCTFAGAVLGLLVGRALLSKQMYLGGVGGAVMGVYLSNKEGNFGACIRALGKLVLYACDRLAYFWSELKFNWKAWRVYERSFKKLESLDKEMQVSERIKSFDRQYQVSNNVNMWWKKFQTAAKSMEENLKEQAVYWQRAQRLREEQKQASLIQQEIQRQQERERYRKTGGVGPVPAGGGGRGPSSAATGAAGGGASSSPSFSNGGGGGGGFQAVVGDAAGSRWTDRSDLHPGQKQQRPLNKGDSAAHQAHSTSSDFVSHAAGLDEEQQPQQYEEKEGDRRRAAAPSSDWQAEINKFVKKLGGTTSTQTRGSRYDQAAAPSVHIKNGIYEESSSSFSSFTSSSAPFGPLNASSNEMEENGEDNGFRY